MRIRQIRPEFFTDPVTAHLRAPVQVTYIGLWCVADDAGWLAWDVPQIGALLYPYKSGHAREALVTKAGEELVTTGRLVIHKCGCALVVKLADHQRIGGSKSFQVRDRHRVHRDMDLSASNVTVSNVTVGNGTREAGPSSDGLAPSEFAARVPRLVALGGKA